VGVSLRCTVSKVSRSYQFQLDPIRKSVNATEEVIQIAPAFQIPFLLTRIASEVTVMAKMAIWTISKLEPRSFLDFDCRLVMFAGEVERES
jgi:hypothetical protein